MVALFLDYLVTFLIIHLVVSFDFKDQLPKVFMITKSFYFFFLFFLFIYFFFFSFFN